MKTLKQLLKSAIAADRNDKNARYNEEDETITITGPDEYFQTAENLLAPDEVEDFQREEDQTIFTLTWEQAETIYNKLV